MRYFTSIIVLSALIGLSGCNSETKDDNAVTNEVLPVETLNIVEQPFSHYIEVTGQVEAVQFAYISPETPGQIKTIAVKEGDRVSKGQILLTQNSSVIDNQIKQVQAQLELAKITFEKQDDLWNNKKVGSEIQYLQAKAQKESLESQLDALISQKDMAIITAPFSGIVDKINLKEGELANPGMQAIELVNLDQIKINADVSEKYLPVVHKGDSVVVSFTTYPDLNIHAPVYRTGNIIKPANRTFAIEVRMDNKAQELKPNMISTLKIEDYHLDKAIVVPSIVIKKDFEKDFVFTAVKTDSSWVAKKVFIKTGRSYQDQTVVTDGLNLGDRLIVKGYNTVSNGIVVEFKQ
ncbi:MAG: efflux RND transporter periplasmic adaptor subunit [Bacteroidales bacterium]|nr:efflux RND transporter periplasmic adaptor subunit [Bacteroidales bacterium]